jgi:hypothetical protein
MLFDKVHFLFRIRIQIRIHNLKLRIHIRIRILQKVSDSYGSGSYKKFRILADPDPQHWRHEPKYWYVASVDDSKLSPPPKPSTEIQSIH